MSQITPLMDSFTNVDQSTHSDSLAQPFGATKEMEFAMPASPLDYLTEATVPDATTSLMLGFEIGQRGNPFDLYNIIRGFYLGVTTTPASCFTGTSNSPLSTGLIFDNPNTFTAPARQGMYDTAGQPCCESLPFEGAGQGCEGLSMSSTSFEIQGFGPTPGLQHAINYHNQKDNLDGCSSWVLPLCPDTYSSVESSSIVSAPRSPGDAQDFEGRFRNGTMGSSAHSEESTSGSQWSSHCQDDILTSVRTTCSTQTPPEVRSEVEQDNHRRDNTINQQGTTARGTQTAQANITTSKNCGHRDSFLVSEAPKSLENPYSPQSSTVTVVDLTLDDDETMSQVAPLSYLPVNDSIAQTRQTPVEPCDSMQNSTRRRGQVGRVQKKKKKRQSKRDRRTRQGKASYPREIALRVKSIAVERANSNDIKETSTLYWDSLMKEWKGRGEEEKAIFDLKQVVSFDMMVEGGAWEDIQLRKVEDGNRYDGTDSLRDIQVKLWDKDAVALLKEPQDSITARGRQQKGKGLFSYSTMNK